MEPTVSGICATTRRKTVRAPNHTRRPRGGHSVGMLTQARQAGTHTHTARGQAQAGRWSGIGFAACLGPVYHNS